MVFIPKFEFLFYLKVFMNFSVFRIFKCFIFNFILNLKDFRPNRFGWTEPARRGSGAARTGWTARGLAERGLGQRGRSG